MSEAISVLVTNEDTDVRLDRWLRRRYPNVHQGRLEKLFRTGQIRVDGHRVKGSLRLVSGNSIRIPPILGLSEKTRPPKTKKIALNSEKVSLVRKWVIFKNNDILAINKPSGLAVQGGTGIREHLDLMLDALRFDAEERPRLVHRLDRDTSGVLLLARTISSARELAKIFREKELCKTYWALTAGVPAQKEGRIDIALLKKKISKIKDEIVITKDGMNAITDYKIVERVGNSFAWLSLRPHTGRTHQIRIHCAASLNCPIVGDKKYNLCDNEIDFTGLGDGLHLHSRSLQLSYTSEGNNKKTWIDLVAPIPEHMSQSWEYLGFDKNYTQENISVLDT